MRLNSKDKLIAFSSLLLIIILFIAASFAVQQYNDSFISIVERGGAFGMLIYVLITVVAIVIAPISTIPLLPIASNLWGFIAAALLSIIGWAIGAMVAFSLARTYGAPLISKLISIQKLHKLEDKLPKGNLFWSVVYLRMILPVDLLSYLLGLFSTISWRHYFLATLIGITPFAFIFSYIGSLEAPYQLIFGAIGLPILSILYIVRWKK